MKRNKSKFGGGSIIINKGACMLIEDCNFIEKSSRKDGGDISNRGNTKNYNSIFENNEDVIRTVGYLYSLRGFILFLWSDKLIL